MLLLVALLAQAPVVLTPGMVITRSVRVAPRVYRFTGAPIVIRGDNITVDFAGATLQGVDSTADPDQAVDTAIVVDGGHNVRITRAKVHGYKLGILARQTAGLTIDSSDLSRNWKPRLFSLVEHESLVDWLSFHHNENREWLRFGAAIYLEDVTGAQLRGNVAVGGMNALLLVRTTAAMIRDNNFSFNSGLGIGLYRSSHDSIIHNQLDFNVRGYSHRFYTRGQDSADLLLFEQSDSNLVLANSMTHGGDGIFLWAGQTTMDSGTGGANDNLFYNNDVSYSTANGVEATFSRNRIIANRAWGNEYGVWGGYSYETEISHNDLALNRTGVAIEHGQDNVIAGNRFDRDSTAISLWADSIAPSDWGYPKHHDTRSRDYVIGGNEYVGNTTVLKIRNTSGTDSAGPLPPPFSPPPQLAAGVLARPTSSLALRDRAMIIVDEWGPYDWKSPKLWPLDSTRAVPLRLATLGPRGSWRVVARRGVAVVTPERGEIGELVIVTPAGDDWEVTLESGGRRFSYGRFEPRIDWTVRLSSDSVTRVFPRLDLMWYRPPKTLAFFPAEHWSLDATGTVTVPPGGGVYSVRTISDDAIRVWIDDSLAIDDWTPHESQVDYAALSAGTHRLRVVYQQVDGWVELRVEVVRGAARSAGSPGPH